MEHNFTDTQMLMLIAAIVGALNSFFLILNKNLFVAKADCSGMHDKKDPFVQTSKCESNHERKRKMVQKLSDRLSRDESEYLTKDLHNYICSENVLQIKLYITEELKKTSEEIKAMEKTLLTAIKAAEIEGRM